MTPAVASRGNHPSYTGRVSTLLSIRVSDDLYARLPQRAREREQSLSSLVWEILNIALTGAEEPTNTGLRARLIAQARATDLSRDAHPYGDPHD